MLFEALKVSLTLKNTTRCAAVARACRSHVKLFVFLHLGHHTVSPLKLVCEGPCEV